MNRNHMVIFFALILPAFACRSILTETPAEDQVFDALLDGLTPAQIRAHLAGDEAFGKRFTSSTGLGPIFNQNSCDACHPSEGRAHPVTNLIRFGTQTPEGFDYMHDRGGPQLQDRAIPGYPAETLPPDITGLSERGGPLVVGLGLIEAIPDAVILANEDPDDADSDGISGRANFVEAPVWLHLPPDKIRRAGKYLGRFGRKATAINLLHQTVGAYFNDMGVTSDFIPEDIFNPQIGNRIGDNVPDPEVSAETVNNVVFYLQTLRPPIRRNPSDPTVVRGEALFENIGCAACHIPLLRTSPSPIAPLAFQDVFLYSDLLVHDMGPELADHYPEGDASGTEWRTTPLWGLGIVENLTGGTPFYLHDGRTSSLTEAILWHGGEAGQSRDNFRNLSESDRQALLAFLKSL